MAKQKNLTNPGPHASLLVAHLDTPRTRMPNSHASPHPHARKFTRVRNRSLVSQPANTIPKLFKSPPASESNHCLLSQSYPTTTSSPLAGEMGPAPATAAAFPTFADVAGASALLFLADSSPAPSPPPPLPTLRYSGTSDHTPVSCTHASAQQIHRSVCLSASQRRALVQLGLLPILLRRLGEVVRLRLDAARPPRRPTPRARRRRLPPPHRPQGKQSAIAN